MPVSHEGIKRNYSCFDHFKEVAVKKVNETYGRALPYDIFDFSETELKYKCVAFREDEKDIPEEQEEGEVLSPEAQAALDLADEIVALKALFEDEDAEVTEEHIARGVELELIEAEEAEEAEEEVVEDEKTKKGFLGFGGNKNASEEGNANDTEENNDN